MIKSFTVGVKHHVNLGDYESIEVEASVTMGKFEDWHVATAAAQDALEILLEDTFNKQHKPSWFERIMTKQRKQTQNIQQITEKTR